MFGKVKQWLGIEGVKLELLLPEEVEAAEGVLEGKIRFFSMNEQTINSIAVKMVEQYTRGRRKEKRTDEYELGAINLNKAIVIPADKAIEINFKLPFELSKSDMDELGDRNFILGGLVNAAKWVSGVNSNFRIEAEADVMGTALNPFDKKPIVLK